MCSQYFAFHQLVDVRDLVEPVMPDDWDKYFPEGVQNQYCMSLSQDQATDWGTWNLTTLLRKHKTTTTTTTITNSILLTKGGNICLWGKQNK